MQRISLRLSFYHRFRTTANPPGRGAAAGHNLESLTDRIVEHLAGRHERQAYLSLAAALSCCQCTYSVHSLSRAIRSLASRRANDPVPFRRGQERTVCHNRRNSRRVSERVCMSVLPCRYSLQHGLNCHAPLSCARIPPAPAAREAKPLTSFIPHGHVILFSVPLWLDALDRCAKARQALVGDGH